MALGAATVTNQPKAKTLQVRSISFAGDGAYPGGGTAAFQAYCRTALGEDIDLLAVLPKGPCGGYVPLYDAANDKLLMFESDNGGADGPLQESTTANMSGVTMSLWLIVKG